MSSLNDNESAMLETVNLFPDDFLIGMRLDKFLSDEREDMSRSYIQQLIDAGNISVKMIHPVFDKLRVNDISALL